MTYVTLNAIRAHSPCEDVWKKLLAGLGKTAPDDEPLPLVRILEINGLNDAEWCLQAVEDPRKVRLYAVKCARRVQHLMTDERSIRALDVAEAWCRGEATDEELAAAGEAAWAGARAAAGDAAWAAARAAAGEATWEVAGETAWEAAWEAVGDAAGESARTAAWDAAWEHQTKIFREVFGEGEAK